jgi:hypothetical protein
MTTLMSKTVKKIQTYLEKELNLSFVTTEFSKRQHEIISKCSSLSPLVLLSIFFLKT